VRSVGYRCPKVTGCDKNFAVNSRDLASALNEVGSTASAFGYEIEEVLGYIAAIGSVTGASGAEIGNSLSIIMSRLTTMEQSEQALNAVNINMRNMKNEVRDGADIIAELQSKWSGLTEEQKRNTAINLGGYDQLSSFIALMEESDISIRATEAAYYSQGSAMKSNEEYMGSLEGRIQQMKTSWEALSLALGEGALKEGITGIVQVLTWLADKLVLVTDTFGPLPTFIGLTSAAVTYLGITFKALLRDLVASIAGILGIDVANKTASNSFRALAISANIAKVAFMGLLVSTGVGLVYMALGLIIEKVIGLFIGAKNSQEQYFESLKQSISDTNSEISSLEELNKKLQDGNLSREELNAAYEETARTLPSIISHYDEEGNAVYKTKEEIEALIESQKALNLEREKALYYETRRNSGESAGNIESAKEDLSDNQRKHKEALARLEALQFAEKFSYDRRLDDLSVFSKEYIKAERELKEQLGQIFAAHGVDYRSDFVYLAFRSGITESIRDAEDHLNEVSAAINMSKQTVEAGINEFADTLKAYNNILINDTGNTDRNIRLFLNQLAASYLETADITKDNSIEIIRGFEQLSTDINQYIQDNQIDLTKLVEDGEIDSLINELKAKFSDSSDIIEHAFSNTFNADKIKPILPVFDELGNYLGEISGVADEAAQKFADLEPKMEGDKLVGFTGRLRETADALEIVLNMADEVTRDFNLLEKAESELNDTGQLSTETTRRMIEKYDDLVKTTGLNKDKLLEFIDVQKEGSRTGIEDQIKLTTASLANTRARIEQLNLERAAYINTAASMSSYGAIGTLVSSYYNRKANKIGEQIEEQQAAADQTEAILNVLNNLSNELDRSTSTNGDYNNSTRETIELLTKEQRRLEELNLSLNKFRNNRNQLKKGTDAYRKSLEEEIKLLKEQKQIYDDAIKNPSILISTKVTTTTSGSSSNVTSSSPSNKEQEQVRNNAKDQSSTLDSNIYKMKVELVDNERVRSQNKITAIDDEIRISEYRQSRYSPDSAEWRKEEMIQSSYLQRQQKLIEEENDMLKRELKNNNITSGEFDRYKAENSIKWWEIEVEVREKRYGTLMSSLKKYENAREEYEQKLKESEIRASQLDPASSEYRKELQLQEYLKKLIQKQNAAEMEIITKKLEEPKNYQPKDVEALEARLEELQSQNIDIDIDISDINSMEIDSYLEEFSDRIKEKNNELDVLQDNLAYLDKGSPEYTKELMKQIPLLQDKLALNEEEIAYLESQIKRTDISAAKRKELNDLLVEARDINRGLLLDERALRAEVADNIIEDYKKAIEKKRDLELGSLDEAMKKEEERHNQRIKNLDDEYKRFEKYINAQLKAMDRQHDSDDYEKELNQKIKERQEIIDRLNVLRLDNSMEAKAKRKDLQEQLDAKNEEIDEFKLQRERALRKQGLQDQLDDRKEFLDKVQKDEDEQYDQFKKKNEQEKKDIEIKYKNMLEDEKRFYELKQGLLSQDKAIVKSTLDEIKGFYTTLYEELAIALKNHVITSIGEYNNLNYIFDKQMGNIDNYYNAPIARDETQTGTAKQKDWQEYLNNKQKAESLTREVIQLQREKVPDTDEIKRKKDEINRLRLINEGYRTQHGFPDGSFDELKNKVMSAESGALTPAWGSDGKLLWAHEKELILNKSDTSNLLKVIDFTRGIVDSLKGTFNLNAIRPMQAASSTDNSVRIDQVQIYADNKDTGTSLLEKFEDALNSRMKYRTV